MAIGYYTSIIRGKQYRILTGPFDTPPTQDMIDAAAKKAIDYDPKCHFDAFGSCKIEAENLPKANFS